MASEELGEKLPASARTLFVDAVGQLIRERYDQRIMSNLIRPHYVEFMVGAALDGEWRVISADWAGWDLEHTGGARVEIKQSAALQTWTGRQSLDGRTTRGCFDVRRRTGYWTDNGARWIASDGRCADLFIFAWHPVTDRASADQRDPWQWQFHVVLERDLPAQKTISLTTIKR